MNLLRPSKNVCPEEAGSPESQASPGEMLLFNRPEWSLNGNDGFCSLLHE